MAYAARPSEKEWSISAEQYQQIPKIEQCSSRHHTPENDGTRRITETYTTDYKQEKILINAACIGKMKYREYEPVRW